MLYLFTYLLPIQFFKPKTQVLSKIVMDSDWEELDWENYIYDGHQEIGALAPDGTVKNFRVLGANIHSDLPSTISIELNGKPFAVLNDMQGNICRLINPFSRKIVSTYEFTAFGEENETEDTNPWRYAAKHFDPELNLIYFGKRYYNPELARWLTIAITILMGSLSSLLAFHLPLFLLQQLRRFVWMRLQWE